METKWDPRIARQVRRGMAEVHDRPVGQEEFANWLGYSRTTVQNWEHGRSKPDPAMQFLFHQLVIDPGFITVIKQWSGSKHVSSKHTTG